LMNEKSRILYRNHKFKKIKEIQKIRIFNPMSLKID